MIDNENTWDMKIQGKCFSIIHQTIFSYLMTVDELEFYDEIECDDLFEGQDSRERIMIFGLPYYEIGD